MFVCWQISDELSGCLVIVIMVRQRHVTLI